MNRYVSLLLVALSLAAVSLAQPAQAQQAKWYKGLAYFDNNSQSSQPATAVTATINNGNTGHVNITSTPTSDYNYGEYGTGGTYTGSVGVYYVWGGGSLTSDMVLSTTQSSEATGAGNGTSGGSSMAGAAYGHFSSSSAGWDNKATNTLLYPFSAGSTPPSEMQSVSIGGDTSAYYNGSTQSTVVTADVTFGDPVVTQ